MSAACQVSTQELVNGFCYDKCPPGYSSSDSGLCLQQCPPGFTDHGMACEPPTVLRSSLKPTIAPCLPTQIDKNGSCYEPQTYTYVTVNGTLVPKVSGCGCIRKTLTDRLQCPTGYQIYNNDCVSPCPPGFQDITDASGSIASLYCAAQCPLKSTNGSQRWPFVAGLCVKDHKKRVPHTPGFLTSASTPTNLAFGLVPMPGLPATMASYLANKPGGSSLQDRYRVGQTVQQSLGANPTASPLLMAASQLSSTWDSLFLDPWKLLLFVVIIGLLIFGGPDLFKGIAAGLSALAKGVGLGAGSVVEGTGGLVRGVEQGAGYVASGAGRVIRGVENVAGSTLDVTSDLERSLGSDVAAVAAMPAARIQAANIARPVDAQRIALQQLATAQENYNRIAAGVGI